MLSKGTKKREIDRVDDRRCRGFNGLEKGAWMGFEASLCLCCSKMSRPIVFVASARSSREPLSSGTNSTTFFT